MTGIDYRRHCSTVEHPTSSTSAAQQRFETALRYLAGGSFRVPSESIGGTFLPGTCGYAAMRHRREGGPAWISHALDLEDRGDELAE